MKKFEMSNLPGDWNHHYSRCEKCSKLQHASGTVTCDCEFCEYCGEFRPPHKMTMDPDGEFCDLCCESEEPPTDKWTLADRAYQEWKDGDLDD